MLLVCDQLAKSIAHIKSLMTYPPSPPEDADTSVRVKLSVNPVVVLTLRGPQSCAPPPELVEIVSND